MNMLCTQLKCLDAGKHVLSEVLPCGTISAGVALIEAVEKPVSCTAYAENYCYMQHNFRRCGTASKHGDIGDICYAEGEYSPRLYRDHTRHHLRRAYTGATKCQPNTIATIASLNADVCRPMPSARCRHELRILGAAVILPTHLPGCRWSPKWSHWITGAVCRRSVKSAA